MSVLNAILIRLNIIVWGVVILMTLKGCAGSGADSRDTGSLRCVGYCDLEIDRSDTTVRVEADGARVETRKHGGLSKETESVTEGDAK